MLELLDKRLVVVTGKGGVGKSTVSIALGLLAARRGLRTMVAEIAAQDRVAAAFGHDAVGFHEVELAENLSTISIDPRQAMEEYLSLQLRLNTLAKVLTASKTFTYFAVATPGMSELVTIGKVWELAQLDRRSRGSSRYDLVILDAPASGHGAAMLRAPKTFADIARVGPIANQGRTIHQMLANPKRTAVVAVALPEEMPVNETISLADRLSADAGVHLSHVVVNGLYPKRFTERDRKALDVARQEEGLSRLAREAVLAARSEHERCKRQRAQVGRLRRALDQPVSTLPFLFEPQLTRDSLEQLSRELESSR